MGLGGQTGNGMNWKAVKALLGQSVLLVMWAIVNRLSSDWSLTASLPVTVSFLDDTRRREKSLFARLTDRLVFSARSNKSGWICTLLLGRMQQCKCRARLANECEAPRRSVCLTSSFLRLPLSSRVQIEFMFVHTNRG